MLRLLLWSIPYKKKGGDNMENYNAEDVYLEPAVEVSSELGIEVDQNVIICVSGC